MNYKKTTLHLPEGDFENELLFFDNSDKKILRQYFRKWVELCKDTTDKIGGTRILNLPESFTEAIFCIEMNVGRCVKSIKGSSSSFDHYNVITKKRIQLKAASSYAPSSFGPTSQYDEIYFIFFRNIADEKDKKNKAYSGMYEIYKLDPNNLSKIKVNKKQTFEEKQKTNERPRFCIPKKIISPLNIKPIKTGNVDDW